MNRGYALYAALTLAATAWALLATPRTCQKEDPSEYRWRADGDCGRSGNLRIFSTYDGCYNIYYSVESTPELELPDYFTGSVEPDLNEGGWKLSGDRYHFDADGDLTLPDGGINDDGGVHIDYRECVAEKKNGALLLDCSVGARDCVATETDAGLMIECVPPPMTSSAVSGVPPPDAGLHMVHICTYTLTRQ